MTLLVLTPYQRLGVPWLFIFHRVILLYSLARCLYHLVEKEATHKRRNGGENPSPMFQAVMQGPLWRMREEEEVFGWKSSGS